MQRSRDPGWAAALAEHLGNGGVACLFGVPGGEAGAVLLGQTAPAVRSGPPTPVLLHPLIPSHPIFSAPTPLGIVPQELGARGNLAALPPEWRIIATDSQGRPLIAEQEAEGYLLLVLPEVIPQAASAQEPRAALFRNLVEYVLAKAGW